MDTHFSHDGMQEPTVSGDEFGERSIAGRVAPRKHEASDEDLRRAVDYVVDECFFAVGQAVGTRKTLSYEAVVWWREHYRAKFLKAMQRFGNRWAEDRDRVSAVGFMLAERATRYAGDATAIDLHSAQRASEDVERYCSLHARRAARSSRPDRLDGPGSADNQVPMIAGYWCTEQEGEG